MDYNKKMGIISTLSGYFKQFSCVLEQILPKSVAGVEKADVKCTDNERERHAEVKAEAETEAEVVSPASATEQDGGEEEQNDDDDVLDLFPKTINYNKDLFANTTCTAIPCSENKDQKLIKIENLDGTIGFKYDNNEFHSESAGSSSSSSFNDCLDSCSSNSYKNFNLPSNLIDEIHDLPNPESFNVKLENSDNNAITSTIVEKKYICKICGADFKIRGYLTRHIKKHAVNKAYKCPFYDECSGTKCHPTGGFSRRDTYKTHLKSRHFGYPRGTKSSKRALTAGFCKLCNKEYCSNEEWLEKHIENGECEGLPKDYSVRVKSARRKRNDNSIIITTTTTTTNPLDGKCITTTNTTVSSSPEDSNLSPELSTFSNSSSSSNSSPLTNDSPINEKLVLQTFQNPTNQKPHTLKSQSLNVNMQNYFDNSLINNNFNSLNNNDNFEFNDYNDEYSLDMEQSLNFNIIRSNSLEYNNW